MINLFFDIKGAKKWGFQHFNFFVLLIWFYLVFKLHKLTRTYYCIIPHSPYKTTPTKGHPSNKATFTWQQVGITRGGTSVIQRDSNFTSTCPRKSLILVEDYNVYNFFSLQNNIISKIDCIILYNLYIISVSLITWYLNQVMPWFSKLKF